MLSPAWEMLGGKAFPGLKVMLMEAVVKAWNLIWVSGGARREILKNLPQGKIGRKKEIQEIRGSSCVASEHRP